MWKIVVVVFDLASAFLLMKTLKHLGRSRKWVMLYLWHPLVVVEFAGSGHADAVGVMLVSAGLYGAARMNWLGSGTAFTMAGLVKFLPWVAVPVLIRRLGLRWLLFPGIAALFYLVFSRNGVDALGSLTTFAARWRANDFLFSFLPGAADPDPGSGLGPARNLAAGMVAVVWLALIARRRPLATVYLWTLGALFLLSPIVHPWYLLWLLPALVVAPHPAWWVWTLTVILAYHPLPGFLGAGTWNETGWIKAVEYVPVLLLLPAGILRARFRKA